MPRKTNTVLTISAYRQFCLALYHHGLSQPALCAASGLSNSTVSRWLKILHRRPNLVYISGWQRKGERGNWQALWSWGFMKQDELKPKAMTPAEYHRRWARKQERKAAMKTLNKFATEGMPNWPSKLFTLTVGKDKES